MLKYHQLHKNLFRLAVVPVFITCSILVVSFSLLHKNEITQQREINERLIKSFFSKNNPNFVPAPNYLDIVANTVLNIEQFHGATFVDSQNKTLKNYGLPEKYEIADKPKDDNYWCKNDFCFYYYLLPEAVDDNAYAVILTISSLQNSITNYRAIVILLVTAIICLFVTLAFAQRFRDTLIKPIEMIRNGLLQFLEGDYTKLISTEKDEIYNYLIKDINKLAKQQKELQENLQQNIEHSTEELRETLETVEIQNIELDLARKSALQASRVKSEFLANISHEIRTPLNGIIGFAELLKKTHLSSQQDEYLETIDESAKGLLTIINDILDFSRLEIGKLTLEYKPVRIRQVIEDAVRLHAPAAQQKKLRLLTIIDHDIPEHLLGDPLRLKQVLNNLISNAIKFTNTGHILISLSKEDRENSQLMLKFRITDSGIGLSHEQQESLFDAFTQLDSSESRAYGGTGLGLAIAKGLVDRMSGQIGVESELGKGATFWFTSMLGRNPKAAVNQGYLTGTLNNARILVFDSNTLGRNEITHYLRGWGARINEVSDFNNILPTVELVTKSDTIHLAILDGQIDQKSFDKHKLLDVIESLNHNYAIPVVVLAPPNIQRQVEPLLKATHTACMNHPIFCNRLHQQICEQLGIIITDSFSESGIKQPSVVQQKIRILAVDDNAANLRLVTELLKELQVTSVAVSSGAAALEAVKKETFDLILMDIQMPGMDGLEATKFIRQRESKNRRTPVVALTAHAVHEQKAKLLLAGMDDYLTKPVGENELRHVIERWVSRHEVPSAADNTPATIEQEPTESDNDQQQPAPLVDLALSLSLTKNKRDLAMDMLEMLIAPLATSKESMSIFLDEKNIPELQDIVHKLHGGACYCGVPELKSTSAKLDKLLQSVIQGSPLPSDIEEQFAPLFKLIDDLIAWRDKTDLKAFFGIENK